LRDNKGKLYIGYSNNLKRRIREHADRKVYTTSRMSGAKLIYYEAYTDKESAKIRESKLKQFGSSYHGLIKRLGSR